MVLHLCKISTRIMPMQHIQCYIYTGDDSKDILCGYLVPEIEQLEMYTIAQQRYCYNYTQHACNIKLGGCTKGSEISTCSFVSALLPESILMHGIQGLYQHYGLYSQGWRIVLCHSLAFAQTVDTRLTIDCSKRSHACIVVVHFVCLIICGVM